VHFRNKGFMHGFLIQSGRSYLAR